MNLQEYLQRTKKIIRGGYTYQKIRPRIECKDGLTLSVQASDGHYCVPRINDALCYYEVEVGYPSAIIKEIMEYAEEPYKPLDAIYGYVPVDIVQEVIDKHGGIVNLIAEEEND